MVRGGENIVAEERGGDLIDNERGPQFTQNINEHDSTEGVDGGGFIFGYRDEPPLFELRSEYLW